MDHFTLRRHLTSLPLPLNDSGAPTPTVTAKLRGVRGGISHSKEWLCSQKEVFSFRVKYMTVVSSSGRSYLDVDITLSSEAFHNYVNAAMVHVNRALKLIIRLFLVEDLVDSLKVRSATL